MSKKKPKITKTDCREYDGITVGLIDTIINSSRILRQRLKQYHEDCEERYRLDTENNFWLPDCVEEALKDLHQDEDLLLNLQTGPYNPRIVSIEEVNGRESIRELIKSLQNIG